jgi:hypothetical protein
MKDRKAVPLSEQPCYTLISQPNDAEQPSEIQLRSDLGKIKILQLSLYFIVGQSTTNRHINFVYVLQ